ncbi:bifunctional ADP-dependent NAD(P)H-hydrate dehydratase/NAD(P)H-hydrate epimerase [Kocuria sp.]|uniref:bifunctional ADP-dependent NAD(P)H-hydrate dehydratase/NAD(P)H-hydrate epimerase n=1 Tax=Kocuria sp. TaxID=1871328 RepID=UPI0026DD5FFE|nr:bifunctional ADP-dependent NAD(P)H-hydrate dehydratase/NAD(P)H-hydrate epimerase [Kocuria sp.]MDO4918722.1 NAD(P)H-hydrate dehydratase [Kocuria sp.]
MIEAYTGESIRAAEQPLLEQGLGETLMRRAARGLARGCEEQLRTSSPDGSLRGGTAVLLVGSGNNGGDALWAGAFLRERGVAVTAVLTGSRVHREGLAALTAAGGHVLRLEDSDGPDRSALAAEVAAAPAVGVADAVDLMARARLVVDGMLGTGASGGLRGAPARLVSAFREREQDPAVPFTRRTPRIVACDVVSGVAASTGRAPEPVLRAHATVTFGGAKTAHVVSPGEQAGGELTMVPIGIENRLGAPAVHRLEPSDVLAAWPRPGATDTKYSRGVLGVVAGAPSYPGAAIMCTQAAVNAGAGMVRFLGDSTARAMVLARSPEVVCSEDQPWDVHVQAWLAGPGVVGDESQAARVQAVIEAREPAVLDAGALDAAARSVADSRLGAHKILTPHAGELSQVFEWLHGFGLCDAAVERSEIEADPVHWAAEAARLTGATVLLKGATTVVASPVGSTGGTAAGVGGGAASGAVPGEVSGRREDAEPRPRDGREGRGAPDPAASSGGDVLLLSVGGASPWLATAGSGDTLGGILGTVLAHVAEHPDALAALGHWARGEGRWAAAAALGAGLHALASRAQGEGPVPPSVLAENVRAVLTRP